MKDKDMKVNDVLKALEEWKAEAEVQCADKTHPLPLRGDYMEANSALGFVVDAIKANRREIAKIVKIVRSKG